MIGRVRCYMDSMLEIYFSKERVYLNSEQDIRQLRKQGKQGMIIKEYGLSKATIYRYLGDSEVA